MAVGIKTIETVEYILLITVLLMLFYALAVSHLENSNALCLFQIRLTLVLSLEKQVIWTFKCAYFCSRIQSSNELQIIGIRQLTELKTLTYCFQIIRNIKKSFLTTA